MSPGIDMDWLLPRLRAIGNGLVIGKVTDGRVVQIAVIDVRLRRDPGIVEARSKP